MKKAYQTHTLQLFAGLTFLLLIIGFFSERVHASFKEFKPIHCKTAFGEKSFWIQGSTVAFHKKSNDGRSISSINNSIGQLNQIGFKKTLYIDNNKHVIRIKNTNNFNDADDFISITSPKGHKITYPLTCAIKS